MVSGGGGVQGARIGVVPFISGYVHVNCNLALQSVQTVKVRCQIIFYFKIFLITCRDIDNETS